jgi:hypothetical protein
VGSICSPPFFSSVYHPLHRTRSGRPNFRECTSLVPFDMVFSGTQVLLGGHAEKLVLWYRKWERCKEITCVCRMQRTKRETMIYPTRCYTRPYIFPCTGYIPRYQRRGRSFEAQRRRGGGAAVPTMRSSAVGQWQK